MVLLVVGGVLWARHSRASEIAALKTELRREHARQLGAPSVPIVRFRDEVERLVGRAAAMHHPDLLEPGFRIDSLRGKRGVYVRLRERDVRSHEAIAEALSIMEPDVIPHCLGLTPVTMRTLYVKLEPFGDAWLQNAIRTDDPLRLRVRMDEIERYASRDLPLLQSIVASDYLLLTIVRGESRASDEVDLFVIDPRSGAMRLATNTKANGYLITARIEGYRAPSPSVEALARSGASDCSIAAQARTRTGEFGAAQGDGVLDAGVPAHDGDLLGPDAGLR